MSRPDRISPYVSLRWKVIAVLSIVLLLSSVAIIVVTEKHISRSFTELQDRQLRYQLNNWQSLLSDGEETLRQLATFIPLLETGSRKPGGLEHRIGNIIRQHADLLNLEWDIQTIAFYDAGGQLKQAWPTPPASPAAQAWADKARKTQGPVSGIDCSPPAAYSTSPYHCCPAGKARAAHCCWVAPSRAQSSPLQDCPAPRSPS